MDDPTFQLHEGEDERYGLASLTPGAIFLVDLARIMGPTLDEKAHEIADLYGYELEVDGEERILLAEGEPHDLPQLPSWQLVWAQVAPHILEGIEHEDVDPNRVAVSEVIRAYLYWRTRGVVDASEWDVAFASAMAKQVMEDPSPTESDDPMGPQLPRVGAALHMGTGTTLSHFLHQTNA
jgi:hypothetical protein